MPSPGPAQAQPTAHWEAAARPGGCGAAVRRGAQSAMSGTRARSTTPQVLAGCVTVRRQKQNHRLLWVQIRFTHSRAVGPEPKLTRTPRGLRRVRTGYAYQPPALGTYRRRRAACPQGPTYCTYWVRVPASAVPYVLRTCHRVPWLSPQARASDGRDPARAHAQLPHRVAPRRPGCAALTKSAHLPSAFKVNT